MLPISGIGVSGEKAGLIGGPVAGLAFFTGMYLRKKYLALKVSEQRSIHRSARDVFLCCGAGVVMGIFVTMPSVAERRATDHIEDVADEIADLYDKFKALGVEINNLSSKLRIEKKQIKNITKRLEGLEEGPKKEDLKSLHRVHEAAAAQYKLVIIEKEEEQKSRLDIIRDRIDVLHPLHLGEYGEVVDNDEVEQEENNESDHAINSNIDDIENGGRMGASASDEDFHESKGLDLVEMGDRKRQVREEGKGNIYKLEDKDLAVMEFNRMMESAPIQNTTLLGSNEGLVSSSSTAAKATISSSWWDFFE